MTSITGATSQTCTSLPFGDGLSCTGTEWGFNHFTDDVHDGEDTLEHTWFRQLSTTQGRWMGADPYLGSMDLSNPESLNRYAYVGDSALNYFDPLGLNSTNYVWANGCLIEQTVGYASGADESKGKLSVLGSDVVFCGGSGGGGSTSSGGTTGTSPAASNGKSAADIARCAAKFSSDHSMAAALQAATGGAVDANNPFVNAFLGSDAATISNLITGPNRANTLISPGISQGAVGVVKVVGNLPNPAATGLASFGTATIGETAGGGAFVSSWTDASIATSVLGKSAGKAFAVFSITKAIWDGSTYIFGAVQCY